MTIIVWDGENLATDRQATDGSHKWETDKAWYVNRGDSVYIVSGVGLLKNIIELREWFKKGGNADEFPLKSVQHGQLVAQQLLVVSKDKGLFVYEDSPHPVCRGFEPCAFGEGKDYAYGALAMESTAVEAITIANNYSLHCGKGVAIYSLHRSQVEYKV
tara:strand:+ start:772 stop:1248 length:477 start_codon:yes stop_codon:yes gene_type:complete